MPPSRGVFKSPYHTTCPAPEEYLTNTQQSKTYTNQEMQILTALTKDTLSITQCDTGGCASKGEAEKRRCSIKLSRNSLGVMISVLSLCWLQMLTVNCFNAMTTSQPITKSPQRMINSSFTDLYANESSSAAFLADDIISTTTVFSGEGWQYK